LFLVGALAVAVVTGGAGAGAIAGAGAVSSKIGMILEFSLAVLETATNTAIEIVEKGGVGAIALSFLPVVFFGGSLAFKSTKNTINTYLKAKEMVKIKNFASSGQGFLAEVSKKGLVRIIAENVARAGGSNNKNIITLNRAMSNIFKTSGSKHLSNTAAGLFNPKDYNELIYIFNGFRAGLNNSVDDVILKGHMDKLANSLQAAMKSQAEITKEVTTRLNKQLLKKQLKAFGKKYGNENLTLANVNLNSFAKLPEFSGLIQPVSLTDKFKKSYRILKKSIAVIKELTELPLTMIRAAGKYTRLALGLGGKKTIITKFRYVKAGQIFRNGTFSIKKAGADGIEKYTYSKYTKKGGEGLFQKYKKAIVSRLKRDKKYDIPNFKEPTLISQFSEDAIQYSTSRELVPYVSKNLPAVIKHEPKMLLLD
jgi:hypothetical protein